ncbi:MAG TPA: porin family protein [Paracoccus sp.]|nr:porin family protein [Paracoccus sp. (in: a-proteobacteria)]
MKKLIAIAMATGFAAPAFAGSYAEPVVEAPVLAPAPIVSSVNWTGAYAGATLGFGRSSWDVGGGSVNESGGSIGVHGGYNMDFGNWVAGGELSLAPGFDHQVAGREISWAATARLRAGPKFGDGGNMWGFGSLGVTSVRHSPVGGGASSDTTGWVAGIGLSHMMQNNVMLTGEILHSRSNGTVSVNTTGVALGASFRF